MATPVVTKSSGPDYEPYQKAINNILYSKQKYNQAAAEGNKGLQTWAASNASKEYDQLPTDIANNLKNMDVHQVTSLLNSLRAGPSVSPGGGQVQQPPVSSIPSINQSQPITVAPTTPFTPVAMPQIPVRDNPYDQRVTDLLEQLTGAINQPTQSPYDGQIMMMLTQLQNQINNPNVVDPRTTDQYTAGKAAVDRQVEDNIRLAQEALGDSGFARSTNLAERAQGIANQGTEYLETQLVPQIAEQLRAQDQQGLQNSMMLLQQLSQQQGLFDSRQQAELANLAGLLSAVTGQQGLFDSRQQADFNQQLGLANLELSQQQTTLAQQAQQFEQQQAQIQNEIARLGVALQRTQSFGSVSEEDAPILGVPAGTPSFQASEAALQRQQQLEMLNTQLEADRANLQTRIEADERQASLNRDAQSDAAKINELLSIWQANGKAPAGLEAYGIEPGQAYNPSLTPSQQMDALQLQELLTTMQQQMEMDSVVPGYQSRYSLGTTTAEAMYHAMQNPTLESALADIKANEATLRQMGVDVKSLRKAVQDEFRSREFVDSSGNPLTVTIDPSFSLGPTSVMESVFGR